MNQNAFKAWLKQNKSTTSKARDTRIYAVKTIERKLTELGMPFQDLHEAWETDRFESLRERLRQIREDARGGGEDYRILMPESENPHSRLSNWSSWLQQYGQYLAGASPQPGTNADYNTTSNRPEKSMSTPPTNLILYGPPGTGKTYSTAEEAIRLCGASDPKERNELMQIYQQLRTEGRIEFVTFHQSMSYEDFVEGRQPTTKSTEGVDSSSVGFRLESVPGIFRRLVENAESRRSQSVKNFPITIKDQKVFKMSLGKVNKQPHIFKEAIEGGYALLGYEDIDWSDDRFRNRKNIIEACKAKGRHDRHTEVTARSAKVRMPFIFRNEVRKGDIVIVSRGNLQFRAIGEFTGDYEFHPRPGGDYAHRRTVRWLWNDENGKSVNEIFKQQSSQSTNYDHKNDEDLLIAEVYKPKQFTQRTIYPLKKNELNIPALEDYLNSKIVDGPIEPEPYVLIIDEINRANISKVFGELITLLERDKRLGQPNELKVRLPYSGDVFGVPSNLHILGTMNTADRSIALLDTALRRRFTFREMMPNPSLLNEAAKVCNLDLVGILTTINERIEYLYDREHQIGHAYFIDCTTIAEVDDVMRHKVIPLLAEYFFEDWNKIAAVLGDAELNDGPIKGGFLKRSVLKSPPGLEDGDGFTRFRWKIRSEDEGFDYARLIGQ